MQTGMPATRLLFLIAPFVLSVACAPPAAPERTIDLAPLGVDGWRGLSLRGEALHLVAEGRGILEVDREGQLLSEKKVGERGLLNAAYRDLAVVDIGGADVAEPERYLLLADNEGWLYDPLTEHQAVHFCVVPGIIEDGPVIIQKNDALAVSGDLIVASPRFYERDIEGREEHRSSELRTYRLADGEPLQTVALEDALELTGLAVDLGAIYGVAGSELYTFSHGGELRATQRLDGIERAAGVAIDLAARELLVLDEEADAIRIFALDTLLR
jgi:hypothetical protein